MAGPARRIVHGPGRSDGPDQARCHLGLHANRVALVPGRTQVVSVVSDSGGPLVDAVGEAVAQIGSARDEITGRWATNGMRACGPCCHCENRVWNGCGTSSLRS